MRKLQFHWLTLAVLAGCLVAGRTATAAYPDIIDFNVDDGDGYVPDSAPANTYDFVTNPPPGSPENSPTWHDSRFYGYGLLERVPSGHGGVTSPHGSGGHGVIFPTVGAYYGYGLGPRGTPSNQGIPSGPPNAGLMLGGNNAGVLANWSYQTDIYLDNNNSLNPAGPGYNPFVHPPDYWWNCNIGNSTDGGYITGSGFWTYHVSNSGSGTFDIRCTDKSAVVLGVQGNKWYTEEVRFDFSGTYLSVQHNLFDIDDHTISGLLGSYVKTTGILSTDAQGGPYSTSFPYWNTSTTNSDYIGVDNLGVGPGILSAVVNLKGDMNDDGVVNGFDTQPFEIALADPTGYLATYPTMDETKRVYRGDINEDSAFDGFDTQPFEQLIAGGGGMHAVPEPSTFALLVLGGLGLAFAHRRRLAKK